MNILQKFEETKILPVIEIDDYKKALPLAKAISDGGIDVIEITLRTESALDSIRQIAMSGLNVLVGAGTVLSKSDVKNAHAAGAKFIVSPGYSKEVVAQAKESGLFVIPGVSTCTEIMYAINDNLNLVKFFPSEALGGVKTVKAFTSVFKNMKFFTTGGINLNNIKDYLSINNVICVGGSFVAEKKLIDNNDFETITELCKKAKNSLLNTL